MYRAKSRGRDRFEVFDAEMRSQVTVFMRTEGELRRALERDELDVLYQPIVDLAAGTLAGFEALVHWRHPERGALGPQEFLAVAEETGLSVPLGDTLLRQACRQARAWDASMPAAAAVVCVDPSPRQLADAGVVARVQAALGESGLEPRRLVLEIGEAALAPGAEAALERMTRLRQLGVRLHLGDFGSGYSALGQLHRLPVEALKLGHALVTPLPPCERTRAVVGSILSLARSLGLTVVAEAVETAEQAALLRELGCGYAQGSYFSPALEPAAAAELLRGAAAGLAQGRSPGRASGAAGVF
jgi:EAL domain-containing protein (putative c-di-GMP-specific phosphodiesterase class I)